ncbi:protein of unknown function [Azospirillum lipoferum 4B]|uniref:Uncharacterized protein n=1 Tax=Azospirillum lipoferum (strain 4B) TaxID=862719 RepID=G7Z385_AZOL4|nr:protein of unknown function [Azospirillum lipoferum 4B]
MPRTEPCSVRLVQERQISETGEHAPTHNNINHRNLQVAALFKGRSGITRYVVA